MGVGLVVALLLSILTMQALNATAAPGDDDSTFVPVSNCRLFDTRPGFEPSEGKKSPLGAGNGNVHTQQVTGSVGDCVIPSDASAVQMNVTIVGPTAQSNLRCYPADLTEAPNASCLNWLPGQSPTPNEVTTKLSPDGKMKFFNQNGQVNLLVDLSGYYTQSSLKEIQARLLLLEAKFAPCVGTPVSTSAVHNISNGGWDLRMTGGTPGVPATYTGQVLLNFAVDGGDVTGNPQSSDPPDSTGTTTGSFAGTPSMTTTWSNANRGIWDYTNIKMVSGTTKVTYCGTYAITPQTGPLADGDTGTFTMVRR